MYRKILYFYVQHNYLKQRNDGRTRAHNSYTYHSARLSKALLFYKYRMISASRTSIFSKYDHRCS